MSTIPYPLSKRISFQDVVISGGGGGTDLNYVSLTLYRLPSIIEYKVGDTISFEGMVLFAIYTDGERTYYRDVKEEAISNVQEGEVVTEDTPTTITFTYTEDGVTGTASYTIEVFTGWTWAHSTDEELVDAMTQAYNGQIDINDYFSVGDVREVRLTDGRYVHLVLKENTNSVKGASTDSHGATNGKFLVTMEEYFQGYSEIYYYGRQYSTPTLQELKIPKRTERAWEEYTFYDLIPASLKPIFRLLQVTAYTTDGNYSLRTVRGDVHFGYYSGYWYNSSKGYRPSGVYDSTWRDSSTWGSTKLEDEVYEFVDIDNALHKAKYIAGLFSESSSASNPYTTGYIGVEDNSCYVMYNNTTTLKKNNNTSVTVTINDLGVSFVGMI